MAGVCVVTRFRVINIPVIKINVLSWILKRRIYMQYNRGE